MQAPRCLLLVFSTRKRRWPSTLDNCENGQPAVAELAPCDDLNYLQHCAFYLRCLVEVDDHRAELGLSTRAQWSEYLHCILWASSRLLLLCAQRFQRVAEAAAPDWCLSAPSLARFRRALVEILALFSTELRASMPELQSVLNHLRTLDSGGQAKRTSQLEALDALLTAWLQRISFTGLALLIAETARAGAPDCTPAMERRQLTTAAQLFENLGVRNVRQASAHLAAGEEQFFRSLTTTGTADNCERLQALARQLRMALRSFLPELEDLRCKAALESAISPATANATAAAAVSLPAVCVSTATQVPEASMETVAPVFNANSSKKSFSRRTLTAASNAESVAVIEISGTSSSDSRPAVPAARKGSHRLLQCSLNTPAVSRSIIDGIDDTSTPSPPRRAGPAEQPAEFLVSQQQQDLGLDDQRQIADQQQVRSSPTTSVTTRSSTRKVSTVNGYRNGANGKNNSGNVTISSSSLSSSDDNSIAAESSPAASASQQQQQPFRLQPTNRPAAHRLELNLSDELASNSNASSVRRRRPWNDRDSFLLYIGYVRHGPNWVGIRNKLLAHATRTNVQVKDRWRTMLAKNMPGRLARRLRQLGITEDDVRNLANEELLQLVRTDLELRSILF